MRLKALTASYVAYRRSLGEKYNTEEKVLARFVRHCGASAAIAKIGRTECDSFLWQGMETVASVWFRRHSVLKGFYSWLVARGYAQASPLPVDLPKRPESAKPYIYSNDELRRIFAASLTYQVRESRVCPEDVQAALVLTYTLGLRASETMSLRISDVDMSNQTVRIREAKFYKTRIVPFNGQVRGYLERFLAWRTSQGRDSEPEQYVFLDRLGSQLRYRTIQPIFMRVRLAAGVTRPDHAGMQPRLHDLRHTFAVNRLAAWYRNGDDVQSLLPLLSTYLGHAGIEETKVYLTMTSDILSSASDRFEQFANKKGE